MIAEEGEMNGSIIIVLLVILLPILPKPSYGQSSWILWDRQRNTSLEKPGEDTNESWELIAVYPSYELCLREGSDKCDKEVEVWKKYSAIANVEYEKTHPRKREQSSQLQDPVPIMSVIVFGTNERCIGYWVFDLGFISKRKSEHSFECFPETFDPRK